MGFQMTSVWIILKLFAGFAIFLMITHVLHFRYFKVDVVLYSALFDVLGAWLFATLIGIYYWVKSRLLTTELVLVSCLVFFAGYAFAISIPTVIDRSLSFYLLEKLDRRGGAVHIDEMSDIFRKDYMLEHSLLEVRLTEQLESSTIIIKGDCVHLTDWGRAVSKISDFYRKNFLPKNRLILDQYTAKLTDPLKNSALAVPGRCSLEATSN
ncbi:hypothetical protein N9L23_06405 [Alphaproteobacteria bacterium]|nr:hypothetical protein [Alphaproteobacteria bacterium]